MHTYVIIETLTNSTKQMTNKKMMKSK